MASMALNYGIEEMKAAGMLLLRRVMNTLARKGDFDPAIFIVLSRDEMIDVQFDYDCMNSEAKKEVLFAKVREEARRQNARAVIVVCDAFTVHYSEEEKRRIREDLEYQRRYENIALRAGSCAEIEAAGFGRKVECISITVQSPTDVVLIQQIYERAGAEKRSILFGHRVVEDSGQERLWYATGRMAIWNTPGETGCS